MPKFSQEFTAGNLASIATTLIAVGTLVWYMSAALADLRGTDALHSARIERIESDMGRSRADHDLLIEIRQDLKMLRQQFDAAPRRGNVP